jgi:hypothetical protein
MENCRFTRLLLPGPPLYEIAQFSGRLGVTTTLVRLIIPHSPSPRCKSLDRFASLMRDGWGGLGKTSRGENRTDKVQTQYTRPFLYGNDHL